jgi:hypothetical protein
MRFSEKDIGNVVTGLKAEKKKRRRPTRDSAQGLVEDRIQLARRLDGLNELIGRILDHGGYFEELYTNLCGLLERLIPKVAKRS